MCRTGGRLLNFMERFLCCLMPYTGSCSFSCEMKNIKMKKILLACAVLMVFSFSCVKKSAPESASTTPASPVNDLPSMTLHLADGSQVQAKNLTGSTIIVLFQPDCDHCQREAKAISENAKSFQNYTLYFVSSVGFPELEAFARQYELNAMTNVHFANTEVQSIIDNFGSIPAPSLYVYNNLGKLTTKFNGETDITDILKSI